MIEEAAETTQIAAEIAMEEAEEAAAAVEEAKAVLCFYPPFNCESSLNQGAARTFLDLSDRPFCYPVCLRSPWCGGIT